MPRALVAVCPVGITLASASVDIDPIAEVPATPDTLTLTETEAG